MKIRESLLDIKRLLKSVYVGTAQSNAHNAAVAQIAAIVDILIANIEPTPEFEKLVMDEIIKLQEEITLIKQQLDER